ncbi:hypothetical protein COCSUDRAFT_43218 [Coccomyxa subellipsoidea C-169]|uniref:Uncharacterized protein n=1 Tax=Coccomyxa subellipsoidea (strain C-169) TaxID=574566 RepID=I0YSY6_COCSC|nr:hypothetical protein COCSUDRAFT_43218 [Coccomyxa subellipsoidea C-169]EIE21505.1 hypothetical protein COCSUDRAFT_43218 [Coccomyxa subellipsoidea C-169]|eukprot:XP_005646049.1 hypothetical protein COCSUDRAFT_43218 [Coccomyxa subellipsoidea C-169]
MAGDALGGHKDEGDQGYNNQGYQQGRPEGIPVGGGGYEGGQQGYGGNQFEGQYEGHRPEGGGGYGGGQGYGNRPEGYRPGEYGGQEGGSGPMGFNPQDGGGGGGYRPQEQGFGGEQDQDDGGFDWSSLGRLVSSYQGAAQQSNGNPSFGSFQNMVNEQGAGQHLNGGMMDKLSGMFQSHTGQQFGGSSMQSQMMAKFVSSKLGFDVPPQMLEKMMAWKQAGHF